MDRLTDRQRKLLLAIINEFIQTTDAVASLHLADKYKLPISSATIRSEMKQLSDAGYLKQLHTSSGRVPTTTGIRFFINQMLGELDDLEVIEQEKIKRQIFHHRFSRIQLIREALKSLVNVTNTPAIFVIENNVYYAGLGQMLDIAEFTDLDQLQKLLFLIEDPELLVKMFERNKGDSIVRTLIGDEMGIRGMDNFATVFTEVRLHGGDSGYLAVLGPTGMNYPLVIPVLKYVYQVINQSVKDWR